MSTSLRGTATVAEWGGGTSAGCKGRKCSSARAMDGSIMLKPASRTFTFTLRCYINF